ncbi:hypothetical protein ACLOJK_026355 [Asimina triloba]
MKRKKKKTQIVGCLGVPRVGDDLSEKKKKKRLRRKTKESAFLFTTVEFEFERERKAFGGFKKEKRVLMPTVESSGRHSISRKSDGWDSTLTVSRLAIGFFHNGPFKISKKGGRKPLSGPHFREVGLSFNVWGCCFWFAFVVSLWFH